VIFYVDASVVVAVVASEESSPAVDAAINATGTILLISDFALAESSAALARSGRIQGWSHPEMDQVFNELDAWSLFMTEPVQIAPEDVASATVLVRNQDLVLRAPDAIHLAAARRLDVTILTLDRGMSRAASLLGVPCINPVDSPAV
jgi:predicted nucleic acid-binding protein